MKTQAGLYILEYRKRNKLSQAAVAERVGVKQSVISDIERGVTAPSVRLAQNLSSIMGVSLDNLLSKPRSEATPCQD